MSDNIALAGIPRSGTTLVCALLDASPGTVALDEPIDPSRFASGVDRREAIATIDVFFAFARASLEERGLAPSLHTGGRLPDDHFAPGGSGDARRLQVSRGEVAPDEQEAARIVAKHPVLFTTFLAELAGHMPCYAVVRNPLAVLASWNSVDIWPRSGSLPIAEANEPSLATRVESASDEIDRQLHLLSWFFEQYESLLPPDAVLRYEEVVRHGRPDMGGIALSHSGADVELQDRNRRYPLERMQELAERLLASDGAYWDFYTPADIEALL